MGIPILIFSAILHEVMHGWVADKLGDPTPRLMGRLTLNPIPHIDPLMSIIVPFLLVFLHSPIIFGAAKPVPINPNNLHDGKKDFALVALAGPFTNFSLAIISALLFQASSRFLFANSPLSTIFFLISLYNLMLGFLNLIPIPPLDGSRVISYFLPGEIGRMYRSLEPFGIFILFMLLAFPFGGFSIQSLLQNLIFSSMKLLGF